MASRKTATRPSGDFLQRTAALRARKALSAANRLLSKAQNELSKILYHGAASEIPRAYDAANRAFSKIESARHDLAR